ncbi:MAG: hypothetical protein NC489_34480 [Ruminococcus flavefaciens]|nr:hypothetical protein [Ruminococcus flavefaciens]
MTNIVIVEDKLENGRNLAQQFEELASNQKLDVRVKAICLFYEDSVELAEAAIRSLEADNREYEIRPVSLFDFDEVMDEYLIGQPTIAIMDFLLESAANSGARGIPTRRVNIRYARNSEKNVFDRIWFYTTGGKENVEILCDLFGQGHVLQVASFKNRKLSLQLENRDFMEALKSGGTIAVTTAEK